MFKKRLIIVFLFLHALVYSQYNSIKLISWNIRDFGQTKDDQELEAIAEIIKEADIIAIQEVVAGYGGAQAVAKLSDILNRKGAKWEYSISDPTTSPAYMTERYAYLWKTKKVNIKRSGSLLKALDAGMDREPFGIDFYRGQKKLTIINVHARPYGKNPIPELEALAAYVVDSLPTPLLVAGDFNTNARHEVFLPLKNQGFDTAITATKTSLKKSCDNGGFYCNGMTDNIFYSDDLVKVRGTAIDFVLECDRLEASRKLSDHLPIFLEFSF